MAARYSWVGARIGLCAPGSSAAAAPVAIRGWNVADTVVAGR